MTGPEDLNRPVNHVLPAWDLLTGLHAAVAILSAERVRSSTGIGQLVQVSLADVAVATMGALGHLSDVALNGHSRPRDGNYPYGSFGSDFRTSDGRRVMIVALTGRQWHNLLDLTGTEEVIAAFERAAEVDFSDDDIRYKYRDMLFGLFRPWFESRPFAEIAEALNEKRVLWGAYRSAEELLAQDDSLLNVSPIIEQIPIMGLGNCPVASSALRFSKSAVPPPSHPPRLGEDTDSVLGGLLNRPLKEIERLRREGVVGVFR
jgi:2-methylfumaryl-CoA isomerase